MADYATIRIPSMTCRFARFIAPRYPPNDPFKRIPVAPKSPSYDQ